ncbi:hypothetical protein AAC387_Pa04g1603 [Persea americana]
MVEHQGGGDEEGGGHMDSWVQKMMEKKMWEIVNSAFWDIVCDELKRIKHSSLSGCLEISILDPDDTLWNYDGPHVASGSTLSEGEELMIDMEKALYEDIKAEAIRRELEYIDRAEEEEDD